MCSLLMRLWISGQRYADVSHDIGRCLPSSELYMIPPFYLRYEGINPHRGLKKIQPNWHVETAQVALLKWGCLRKVHSSTLGQPELPSAAGALFAWRSAAHLCHSRCSDGDNGITRLEGALTNRREGLARRNCVTEHWSCTDKTTPQGHCSL